MFPFWLQSPVSGPVVSLVTPNVGSAAGGSAITVTGANFVSGATVKINGVACTSVSFINSGKITCVTPSFGNNNGTSVGQTVTVTNPSSASGSGGLTKSKFFYYPCNTTIVGLWRGDVGVTTSGSSITEWADQSGNANNWRQTAGSTAPTVTSLNGLNAIAFAAANTQEMLISSPNNLGSGPYTALIVFNEISNVSGFDTLLTLDGNTYSFAVNYGGNFTLSNGGSLVTSSAIAFGDTYCGAVISNGTSGSAQLEPSTATTGTVPAVTGVSEMILGAWTGGFYWNGTISEVLLYSGAAVSADVATAYSIMKQNWATQ